MNIRESIARITKLPENDGEAGEVISKETKNRQKKIEDGLVRQSKNMHLAMFDDEVPSEKKKEPCESLGASLDEGHINSCLAEAYGQEVSPQKFEERLQNNEQIRSPPKKNSSGAEKSEAEENIEPNSTESNSDRPKGKSKAKRKPRSSDFPKNACMRSILENKPQDWSTSPCSSTSSSPAECMFVEDPENADVYYRTGMMNKGIIEGKPKDDGFRFAHRGVKKTVTARRYVLDNVTEDAFVFKTK